jgi:1-acyl-sn-glycerol-3-phosphate acyltransferase
MHPPPPASLGDRLHGCWVWGVGTPLVVLAGIVISATPGIARRRRMARATARALLAFARMPLEVHGLERIPSGACIVVANHASYLDGIVLTAALPPDFSFVIKREAAGVPVVGLLLRRLRSHFVDRFDRHAGRADAGQMMRSAQRGHPIGIFPEGTFIPEPGLRAFHRGAFVTACRAGLPVVPVGIRGTRLALGGGSLLPRRVRIVVEIGPAIASTGRTREAVETLRDRARGAVLAICGEPDRAR